MNIKIKKLLNKKNSLILVGAVVAAVSLGLLYKFVFYKEPVLDDISAIFLQNQLKGKSKINMEILNDRQWKRINSLTIDLAEDEAVGRANPFLPSR